MTALTSLLTTLWAFLPATRDEEGQTMAEYGLILAGIAVIVMATVWLLGAAINQTFADIVAQF